MLSSQDGKTDSPLFHMHPVEFSIIALLGRFFSLLGHYIVYARLFPLCHAR